MRVGDLQQYYTTKEREIFSEINPSRTAGYWYQSEKLSYHPNDILQFWGPSSKLRDEMAYHSANYFVLSSSDHYYLDCGYPNQFGDRSWWGQIKSWREFWDIDPSMYSSSGKLLGAEAWAWSEMNNEFEMFTKIFPRSGAMSFRYWNPKAPTQQGALHEMMMRLQYRLKAYGVPTEKISMRYCEEHTHHWFGI